MKFVDVLNGLGWEVDKFDYEVDVWGSFECFVVNEGMMREIFGVWIIV